MNIKTLKLYVTPVVRLSVVGHITQTAAIIQKWGIDMGIYISGMKMPTSGELLVIISPNGEVRYKKSVASMLDRTTAIPVPDHGKLVDGDKIVEWCKDKDGRYISHFAAVIGEVVEVAPTIIPAEEGE